MDNKPNKAKPWYKRTWIITSIAIIVVLAIIVLIFSGTITYSETLYDDYETYYTIYAEDVDELIALEDEWIELADSIELELYSNEEYVTKFTDIKNRYVVAYEYYSIHQKEFITFLYKNKEDLELYLEDFSVIELKKEIQDNDMDTQQKISVYEKLIEEVGEITSRSDVVYQDYVKYQNTYLKDFKKLTELEDDWIEVTNSPESYSLEGYAAQLIDIADEYVDTYEYYNAHQKEFITFLDKNKEDLELYLEDFSVIELKKEIQDNNLRVQQNIEGMNEYFEILVAELEAEQESSQEDYTQELNELIELGKLLALFI